MNILCSLAVITLAALVHASFQLSVSVLTLLSSHALGEKKTHSKLLHLTTSFLAGSGLMTILLLSSISLVFVTIFSKGIPVILWTIVFGLLIGTALAIWLFYYRHEKGTTLWIPRSIANYLTIRIKSTKLGAEAFGLGLSSVVGEILFIIAPLIVSALAIIQLPTAWQLVGVVLYTVISMLSLIIVWVSIGSGHSISQIQRWREANKNFLQFAAGAGLSVLAIFIYVNEFLATVVGKI